MKNYFLKTTAFVLLASLFFFGNAQQPQTASAKTNEEKLKDVQIGKVNDVITNIASKVKISDEQKAKLQASLLECFIKSDNQRATIVGDDVKLKAWREAKIADMVARVKAILTPEQYTAALKE